MSIAPAIGVSDDGSNAGVGLMRPLDPTSVALVGIGSRKALSKDSPPFVH